MKEHPKKIDTLKELDEAEHIPEKEYNCMDYDFHTTQNAQLNKHMEIAYKITKTKMPFKCKDCAQEFT